MDEANAPEKPTKSRLKHFSHYIFEFVMMFLAITLGFFVENQREKLSSVAEERQVMNMLKEDLKFDIERIDEIIQLRKDRITKNDSLIQLLNSPDHDKHMEKIYTYALSANSRGTLFYVSSSMQFLSEEGFYKISSSDVSDKTRKYFVYTRNVISSQDGGQTIAIQLTQQVRRLLNAKGRVTENGKQNLKLFTEDLALINEFINTIMHFNGNSQAQIKHLEVLRSQAVQLIESIDREYSEN